MDNRHEGSTEASNSPRIALILGIVSLGVVAIALAVAAASMSPTGATAGVIIGWVALPLGIAAASLAIKAVWLEYPTKSGKRAAAWGCGLATLAVAVALIGFALYYGFSGVKY